MRQTEVRGAGEALQVIRACCRGEEGGESGRQGHARAAGLG